MRKFGSLATVIVALLLAVQAAALDKEVIDDANKPPPPPALQGWDGTLTLGGNVALGHMHQVVGAQNGLSFSLGVNFAGEIDYTDGPHDWRTTLSLVEGFAYGPPLRRVIKSGDDVKFETTYYYHVPNADWFGPFARFTVNTVLFPGQDHRPSEVEYQITRLDGTVEKRLADRFTLSSSFLPTTLKEAVGLFARPVSQRAVEIEFRLGVGAREVFADGQFTLAGVDANKGMGSAGPVDLVRISEIENYQQAGGEAGLGIRGAGYDSRIMYEAWAEAMMPFWRQKSPGDNREFWRMTNLEFGAKVSFKLVEWCSIDYLFKTVRQPQLFDDFQITNNLLVTFAYTLPRRKPPESAGAPAVAPDQDAVPAP